MCGLDAAAPSLFRIRDAPANVNRQPPTAVSDGLPVIVACGVLEASFSSGFAQGQGQGGLIQGQQQRLQNRQQQQQQQQGQQHRQPPSEIPFVVTRRLPSSFVSMREHFGDLPEVHQLQVGGSDLTGKVPGAGGWVAAHLLTMSLSLIRRWLPP